MMAAFFAKPVAGVGRRMRLRARLPDRARGGFAAGRTGGRERGPYGPSEGIRHLPGGRPGAGRTEGALADREAARAYPTLGGARDVPPTVPPPEDIRCALPVSSSAQG
ncbi:hypothetical protein GCM10010269_38300 [Streptomyces humidus]|uniref:Uncharacterized protein n=1 Tax=Streptomyces humidus TaxID=52259 RepID=A0A918FXI3_9ACTN|nr:hypothetical protein GCM10010269_38300 [Streptomyces humidus]